MKRKILLYVVLSLVLSFGVVLATYAAQPTAKDLVLLGIKNFDTGINKAFYEKSQDVTSIKITGLTEASPLRQARLKALRLTLYPNWTRLTMLLK